MAISANLTLLLAVVTFSGALLGKNAVATDECEKTAGMQVYSNVFVHKEPGDLWGMTWPSNATAIQE